MASFHHASQFRRLSKLILLTKRTSVLEMTATSQINELLPNWTPQFNFTNVIKLLPVRLNLGAVKTWLLSFFNNHQLSVRSNFLLQKTTPKRSSAFRITSVKIKKVTFEMAPLTTIPKIDTSKKKPKHVGLNMPENDM